MKRQYIRATYSDLDYLVEIRILLHDHQVVFPEGIVKLDKESNLGIARDINLG